MYNIDYKHKETGEVVEIHNVPHQYMFIGNPEHSNGTDSPESANTVGEARRLSSAIEYTYTNYHRRVYEDGELIYDEWPE